MHTGVAALDVEESLKFAFPCTQKRLPPLSIKRSHLHNEPRHATRSLFARSKSLGNCRET